MCYPCINCVTGSPQDQAKVRRAIANQRVDPADIPLAAKTVTSTTAHVIPSTSQPPALGQKKRKAAFEQAAHTNSQMNSARLAVPATTRSIARDVDDDDEVTIIEPDPVDELYCTLRTNIVGLQYYKGECSRRLSYISINVAFQGLVGPGEEVRLPREPNNPYDRYRLLCIGIELAANETPGMLSRSQTSEVLKSGIYRGRRPQS